MRVSHVIIEGKPKGIEIPILGSTFLIGRSHPCQLRIHNSLISKKHCAILIRDNAVYVRDLESTNGTLMNDQAVKGEVKVSDGDVLRVANFALAFKIQEGEPPHPRELSPDTQAALEQLANLDLESDTTFDGSARGIDPPVPDEDESNQ